MLSTLQILLLVLVVGVVFVNGWTDAPNAITCCVSTGTLPYTKAVRLAAGANFLGLAAMYAVNRSVAHTITGILPYNAARPEASTAGLCAAMGAIVVFAVAAWALGIPTSESHALMAALAGAAAATGLGGVELWVWGKVLWGLALSLGLGFSTGYGATRTLGRLFSAAHPRRAKRAQILSSAMMAFMHGAQDGQKFMAVLLMAGTMAGGTASPRTNMLSLALTALVMSLGTLAGGRRIIHRVGTDMVQLRVREGACADIGGSVCLLAASLWGIPMSTTHTKTTAIMGAGLAGGSLVDWGNARQMVVAWCITFPACGALGYTFTRLLSLLLV